MTCDWDQDRPSSNSGTARRSNTPAPSSCSTRIGHPWVDSSEAPIYRVTFPPMTTEEELASYCSTLEGWSVGVRHPVGWMMDLSQVERVSARQRMIFGKFMMRMGPFDRRYTMASAIAVPNEFVGAVLKALFFAYPPVFVHKVFASPEAALAWIRRMVDRI